MNGNVIKHYKCAEGLASEVFTHTLSRQRKAEFAHGIINTCEKLGLSADNAYKISEMQPLKACELLSNYMAELKVPTQKADKILNELAAIADVNRAGLSLKSKSTNIDNPRLVVSSITPKDKVLPTSKQPYSASKVLA